MRESRSHGSVRGTASNGRSYREQSSKILRMLLAKVSMSNAACTVPPYLWTSMGKAFDKEMLDCQKLIFVMLIFIPTRGSNKTCIRATCC